VGDALTEAAALQGLSLVDLHLGDYGRAATRMTNALALFQAAETTAAVGPQLISVAHANLGQIALAQGDPDRATIHVEEALRRQRTLGFIWQLADTLRISGDLARERGDYERALVAYRKALDLTHDRGDRRYLTNALAGIADVSSMQGRWEKAARLYAVTAELRERIGAGVELWQRARHERSLALVQAALSPEIFAAASAAGRVLPLEQAIAEALVADPPGAASAPSTDPDPATTAGLTAREREVLRLVAAGMSDREIAGCLSISPRTIGGHVTNLLAKLGVDSRTAAAAFAIRHGLA
ncbi:MAG: LuxR C-terminal-related transcriptional regulator, partial [Thermomicrobiales bacterium]